MGLLCGILRNDIGGMNMADNKQYITLPQENGRVMISEDVVAAIVSQTVKDVEGVCGICARRNSDIVEIIGKKNWKKGLEEILGHACYSRILNSKKVEAPKGPLTDESTIKTWCAYIQ